MPTLGHYLMQQKKEVLKRRRQAEGKRRNLRRRAAAEKRHNAAYFVVDVWGGNDYNGGVIHVYMNADEQASFQLLTKQHVFNFKDSHFLTITLQDQIDLETRGFKGLIVRDGDSGRLLHRQRFDPVGGEGDEGEFFRLFARSACHQAEEYYDPAKRASNRIGHNRCMGVKPNRIDAGHSHYARRRRDREEEPDEDEQDWWESFKSVCGTLLDHVFAGSSAELKETEEIFTLLGIETFVGPYTGLATFGSDEWGVSYCPGCHKDNDCCLCAIMNIVCAIMNIDGAGWMAYPEHAVAVEFTDGTGFMFEPKVPHCCTPSPTNRHRQGVGLYCKEALASRGRLKRKLPAGFIVDWAMVEGELELGSESN